MNFFFFGVASVFKFDFCRRWLLIYVTNGKLFDKLIDWQARFSVCIHFVMSNNKKINNKESNYGLIIKV